jgi:hypothetical protein
VGGVGDAGFGSLLGETVGGGVGLGVGGGIGCLVGYAVGAGVGLGLEAASVAWLETQWEPASGSGLEVTSSTW